MVNFWNVKYEIEATLCKLLMRTESDKYSGSLILLRVFFLFTPKR